MELETNFLFIRIISFFTLIYIIRLIYTNNLRIGSSWFLLILGTGFFFLTIWPGSIEILRLFTGINAWFSNILFFLITFLFIILVHCTIMISGLINCVKELGQELTLLTSDINEEKIKKEAGAAHAIEAALTHPLIVKELKDNRFNPSDGQIDPIRLPDNDTPDTQSEGRRSTSSLRGGSPTELDELVNLPTSDSMDQT